MQETKFKCDNCGAEYDEWRAYCRKCQATMPKKPVVTNETLEGCEKAQVCATIGSNSARYYSVFKENEGKTKFNHMNWAAFFFGMYWMFYRRMYKNGILVFLASMVLSVVMLAVGAVVVAPQMASVYKEIGQYGTYFVDDERITIEEYLSIPANERDAVMEAKQIYDKKMFSINAQLWAICYIPQIALMAFVGLRADSMYKKYVMVNVNNSSLGTSGWSVVLAIVVNFVGQRLFAYLLGVAVAIIISLVV